ncbi:MAG: hypothetical protein AAGA46_00165 [Cyanobacteria bacterium P01_F01_bin.13]
MTATQKYKKRLAGLLAYKELKPHLPAPPGVRTKVDSARNLSDVCGNIVSASVVAKWKSGDFSDELDDNGLEAISKIVAHKRKTTHEIKYYLQTGQWLPDQVGQQIMHLQQAIVVINGQIKALVAA